jgi:SagB-type dehydrogenase family enzyme
VTVVPTAEFASLVYGRAGVPDDDPAEAFHEASRLYPNVAPARLATMIALAQSPELQQTAARASRTHDHRPGVDLPTRPLPRKRLRDVLDARRSEQSRARRPISLDDLGALLAAAYRARPRGDGAPPRRPVPSGGALYPLELYALPLAVPGLGQAAFHYQPFRHRLIALRPVLEEEVGAALVDPTLASHSSLVVVVTAMFWRSRFKYGLRGYRFALLEAGHVGQNLVLAATALRLAALPLGGWYDRRMDALVGADGLDEAVVYVVLVGGRG